MERIPFFRLINTGVEIFFSFLAAGFSPKNNGFNRVGRGAIAPRSPGSYAYAAVSADPDLRSVTACIMIKAPSPKSMEINNFSVNTSKSYQLDA